ncbi:GTA-gp10 family protein [uncultured Sphingomonas sp.]|uniref:GTA-gp10 family protein n=1 Tax=uncultured Sphingomonas sp. TaxID=158754 RepID=UPI0025CD3223|nr:GTA-gp10 family protein [uncultured Sphingomonas sp.]
MTIANPDRGEHEIELGGVVYRLRPSHEAIRAIERKTDRSTLELYSMGNRGALSLDHLGVIFGELIRAGAARDLDRHVHDEQIGALVYEGGQHKAMARATLVLIDAASGGRTASGEAKAAATGTIETAGAA